MQCHKVQFEGPVDYRMQQQASNPWAKMLLCLVSSIVVALPVSCVNMKLEHNQGSYGFIQLFKEALSKGTLRHVGRRGDVCDSRHSSSGGRCCS